MRQSVEMGQSVKAPSAGSMLKRARLRSRARPFLAALALAILTLAIAAPSAGAAKTVVGAIGGPSPGTLGGQFAFPTGVAVNNASGDVYVTDANPIIGNRVQRFDSSHKFISAWGFDTIQSGKPGDLGSNAFELCTVAADCKAGIDSVSPAPGGELNTPDGIAVDQSTGNVYVANSGFLRVEVFSAAGDFLRAFGQDVVQSGKPGDLGSSAFEVCTVAADCKAGVSASTAGAFAGVGGGGSPIGLAIAPAGAPNAGNVLVTDPGNRRVSEYTAAGAFVRSFGWDVVESGPDDTVGDEFEICKAGVDVCKAAAPGAAPNGSAIGQFGDNGPTRVAEDSSGAIYTVEKRSPNFRVQKFTPAGPSLTPSLVVVNNEVQTVTVKATAGQFKLTFVRNNFPGDKASSTTGDLPFNAGAAQVQSALNELTLIKTVNGTPGGSVSVSGGPGDASGSSPYVITFDGGPFVGADATQIVAAPGATPLSGGSGPGPNKAIVATTAHGAPGGTSENNPPGSIAIEASGNVVLTKGFLPGSTPNCLNTNSPSLQEHRILEISPAGVLLGTHLACAGIDFPRDLALNPASGRIYLASEAPVNTAQVYVLDDVTPPTATIDPVTEFDAFSATLKGEVDPQGSPTECRFDYIAKAAFEANVAAAEEPFAGAAKVPCESSPGEGSGPILVSAQIKGELTPNTPYKARLVAFKPPFGDVAAASPTSEEFTSGAVPPPTVISGAVAPRGTTTARLSGLVNPNSSPTEVHFEYGTAGPCSANPCAGTDPQSVGATYIPPGLPWTSVSVELKELEPATTYHYRLVGTNAIGTSAGADRTFTTLSDEEPPCANEDVRQRQHSDGYLGSCRAIELVNSPAKGNQHAFSQIGSTANPSITADGERALWSVIGGAPGGASPAGNSFLAERSEGGWASRGLAPPAAQQVGGGDLPYGMENATFDLGSFIANAGSGLLGQGKTLVRLDRDQHQEVLANYEHAVSGSNGEISDDDAHVVVINPDTGQLEEIGDPQEAPETISLMPPPGSPVGVPVPGGTPSACGLNTNTAGESFAGTGEKGAGVHWNPGYRMIAAKDASRVYFEVRPDGNCGGRYGLYVRNRESDATTPIDYGASGQHVEFIRATPDGRSAYFATFSRLDPADQNTGGDVYRWDEEAGESTCLTCVVPNANIDLVGGHMRSIMVSDDFSHVYFQSKAQLLAGHGEAGALNTYALSGGTIRFVAGEGVGRLGLLIGSPQALLSSDGNVLVFLSALEGEGAGGAETLTADPLAAKCPNLSTGKFTEACRELYRYDDRDGSLECISCRHDGETSFSVEPAYQFKMSADGRTVAFTAFEPLVPRDLNQDVDVYEWRDGAVDLISDGVTSFSKRSLARPEVRGVDADGRNIFFLLTAPGLTGFEQDGLRNLYDARIGGGFEPPSPPVHCAEDSCQGPLQAPPPLESAGSQNGSRGNLPEARPRPRPCARKHGKAKRRCIKRHRRKAQRQRAGAEAGRTK
jgi:hypothetical protein